MPIDAPSGYTNIYGIAKWNDGDNPGSIALNNNWDIIDLNIYSASLAEGLTAIQPIDLTNAVITLNYNSGNFKLSGSYLDTIQNIATESSPEFAGLTITGSVNITDDLNANNISARANLNVTGGLSVTGDATIGGKITAEEFHTEVVSSSIIYKSGSTKFGDSADDRHLFTGSVNMSGNDVTIQNNTAIGHYNPTELLHIKDGNIKHQGTASIFNDYISGWTGNGWQLDQGITYSSQSFMELDRLSVRGSLSAYEFLINQIRATNGTEIITSAAKVSSSIGNSGSETITFEDVTGHNVVPYKKGDILLIQNANLSGSQIVKQIVRDVDDIFGLTISASTTFGGPTDAGNIEAGDVMVRIGNTVSASRQGVVYLTSDDINSPFIDIIDGISSWSKWTDPTKIKTRIGKLDGITSNAGQSLDNYGMYANRVFLEGQCDIKGDLSVGDDTTFGNTFFAGRIGKNLFKKSENADWDDADSPVYYWQSGTSTRSNNNMTLPDGTTGKAYGINASTASVFTIIGTDTARATTGTQSSNTYTLSFWARASNSGTTGSYSVTIEYPTDTTIDTQAFTATTDWQRFQFTAVLPAGAAADTFRLLFTNKISSTGYLYMWGFQVEEKAYQTAYQPTDGTLSTETDFGMWAKKGGFGGSMQNPKIALQNEGIIIRSSDSSTGSWESDDTISIGYTSSAWGIIGKSGSQKVFELGSNNTIGQWKFDDDKLWVFGNSIELIGSTKTIGVNNQKVKMYYTDGSNYGISGSGFELGGTNTIAGWDFDSEKLTKGTQTTGISLNTSATQYIHENTGSGFEVYDSSNPKMFIGRKDGTYVDWNVTTADALTISGSITGSDIKSSIFTTGEAVTGDGTYAALAHENPNRPYVMVRQYTDAGNNSWMTMNPDTQTGFQWFYTSGSGNQANIFMFRGLTNKSAYISIDGEKAARSRDRGTTLPTTDLRQGDSFYNLTTGKWYMYDTSDGWVILN